MRIAAVVAASGYSPQQVRDLEATGVLPSAARAPNGYRRFADVHVRALHAYRDLTLAVGPVQARNVMRGLASGSRTDAASLLGSLHVLLVKEREQALAACRALETIGSEEVTDAPGAEGDVMTITELSQALGVRSSALRYWESVGLVRPDRIATPAGTARRYPVDAVREARISTALRAAGYRVPEVRDALVGLREFHDTDRPLLVLKARLDRITDRALALARAGAVCVELVELHTPPPARDDPVA